MLRLLLIRHGETQWNKERRIMGANDIPLNETGRAQVKQLGQDMGAWPPDIIYSSPIKRAKESAEILASPHSRKIIEDPRLQEVGYGDWVGLTFKEARETKGYKPYYEKIDEPVAPGGETLNEVKDRALNFLQAMESLEGEPTVWVLSHADWIKCLVMEVLGVPLNHIWQFRVDNASVTQIECEKARRRVLCFNQRGDFGRLFAKRNWF